MFWAGNLAMFLNSLSRGATMFIMSWYFQAVVQDPPLMAGLKMLPMAIAMGVSAPLAGRLADRFGSRHLATIGLIGTTVSMLWMATFPVNVPYAYVGAALTLLGLGSSTFNAPNTTAVMAVVPAERRGIAAGTRSLLLNSGQTMAIAVTMAIVATTMSYQTLAALFAGSSEAAHALNAAAFTEGLHKVFLVSGILSAIALVCSSMRGADVVRPAAVPAPAGEGALAS
jgi:MFS family permease